MELLDNVHTGTINRVRSSSHSRAACDCGVTSTSPFDMFHYRTTQASSCHDAHELRRSMRSSVYSAVESSRRRLYGGLRHPVSAASRVFCQRDLIDHHTITDGIDCHQHPATRMSTLAIGRWLLVQCIVALDVTIHQLKKSITLVMIRPTAAGALATVVQAMWARSTRTPSSAPDSCD
jgi:hypothetical protein